MSGLSPERGALLDRDEDEHGTCNDGHTGQPPADGRPPSANRERHPGNEPRRHEKLQNQQHVRTGLEPLRPDVQRICIGIAVERLDPVAEAANVEVPAETPAASPQPVTPAPAAAGPVVLTATDAVWLQVKDGSAVLKQGELAAGETYTVPADAAAPLLTTGKPEALRITVGNQQAPAVGEPGRTVSGVSLKAVDLMQSAPTPANPGAAGEAAAQP